MTTHHAIAHFCDDYTNYGTRLALYRSEGEVEQFVSDKLAIADVRRIIAAAQRRPAVGDSKIIFVATGHIAVEAQNALLKILEDPPTTTRFVLWLGQQVQLLPTVRSRLHILEADGIAPTDVTLESFMAMSIPERLSHVATVYKQKDVVADRQLYQGLVSYLQQPPAALSAAQLSEIATLQSLLTSPGAAKKMLWEALALTLPVER